MEEQSDKRTFKTADDLEEYLNGIEKRYEYDWEYSEHFNIRLMNAELAERIANGWEPMRETAFGTRVLILWFRMKPRKGGE